MEAAGPSETVVSKGVKGPRACTTCARAKIRCITGPGGQDKCERCHRLRKSCSSQTPAPPRKRKNPKPTRVAELERRLLDLTARVESAQRLGPAEPSPPDSEHYTASSDPVPAEIRLPPINLAESHIDMPSFGRAPFHPSAFDHLFEKGSIFEVQIEHPQQPSANGEADAAPQGVTPSTTPALTPVPTATTGSLNSTPYEQTSSRVQQQQQELWPQGDEAEAMLAEYKTYLGHLFPFAVVPPDMSSARLREQKPLFWKAVMMKACLFDGQRQDALGNELLKEISQAAFMGPQKDLDLLQGLQLLIACYNYNLSSFQMTNLLFLARSVTTSLGSVEVKGQSDKQGYSSECLEQMRAFAGTYYLVTLTFTTNKRLDALMNTSYLATCCRALHSQMEYPTDELVTHLVRAQQLAHSILQASARRNTMPSENQISQATFIRGLRDRIRGFEAALPPHIRVNQSLIGHLHVAEILLYDNNLQELSHCPFAPRFGVKFGVPDSTDSIPASTAGITHERLELLWACVRALQAFTVTRFEHERGEYPRLICPSSFDLTYVFLTMFKMVSLQVPGLDVERVRQELRFNDCVSRLIQLMEHATERRKKRRKGGATAGAISADELPGDKETDDTYTKLARKIHNLKDHLLSNMLCANYATSHLARDCDPAPMTLADATLQDLGNGPGQDDMNEMPDWDAFLVGDAIDWSGVFNSYMADTGYGA